MLGLLGTLDLAPRSLATQQEGTAVAGQNMANVNNPAYAREQTGRPNLRSAGNHRRGGRHRRRCGLHHRSARRLAGQPNPIGKQRHRLLHRPAIRPAKCRGLPGRTNHQHLRRLRRQHQRTGRQALQSFQFLFQPDHRRGRPGHGRAKRAGGRHPVQPGLRQPQPGPAAI